MCEDCGCQDANKEYFNENAHTHDHEHPHDHNHIHERKTIDIEQNVLKKNGDIAHQNSHWFNDHNVKAINIMSSPGSGKTTLLEKTIPLLKNKILVTLLVGDQQTDHDANRLLNCGGKVKQINTHSSCHLDALMIQKELGGFVDGSEDLLIIENIGNLVCPSAFDLGENKKIAMLSTTEGEDKPIKYPVLFHRADLILITKIDLIPHLDWSMEKTKTYIKQVNPKAKILEISAKTGEGIERWCEYLIDLL